MRRSSRPRGTRSPTPRTAPRRDRHRVTTTAPTTRTSPSRTVGSPPTSPHGQDVLAFTVQDGITGSYNAAHRRPDAHRPRHRRPVPGGAARGDLANSQRHPDRLRAPSASRSTTGVANSNVATRTSRHRGERRAGADHRHALAYTENEAAPAIDSRLTSPTPTTPTWPATVRITANFATARTCWRSPTERRSPAGGTPLRGS